MREVVIVSAVRTPVGKAYKGTLRATRPDDLAAFAIEGPWNGSRNGSQGNRRRDSRLCHARSGTGMNVARIAVLRAGLPIEVPAATVNRLCSSGLEAIARPISASEPAAAGWS